MASVESQQEQESSNRRSEKLARGENEGDGKEFELPEFPETNGLEALRQACAELQLHQEFGSFFSEHAQQSSNNFDKVLTRIDECALTTENVLFPFLSFSFLFS